MTESEPLSADLLLRELGWVRDLARSLLRRDDLADDVVQETWLAASRQAPPTVRRVRPWLATIVHNQVRRLARGARRRAAREDTVARAAADATTDDDVVARGELYRELTDAVMRLDAPYREAVLLRHLDGLAGPEVAARLGVTAEAARQRIARGLAQLRERLERQHLGGFAAWASAWTRHLGDLAPTALTAAAGAPAIGLFSMLMNAKWLVAAIGGLLALGSWWLLRDAVAPPPAAAANRGPDVVAATDAPSAPSAGDTVERRAAAPGERSLAIVDTAGAPIGGAHVFALAGGTLRERAVSDARGVVRAPGGEGCDGLLLAAPARVPLRLAAAAIPASGLVVWSDGLSVAGHIALPAGRHAELVVASDARGAWADGLADDVLAALAALGCTPDRLQLTLPGDGAFAVRGFDGAWSGSLELADGWTVRGVPPRWRVRDGVQLLLCEPANDVELVGVPPVEVRGRLLSARTPAVGVALEIPFGGWALPRRATGRSGADGRFGLAVARPAEAAERLWLVVGAPGAIRRELRLPADGDSLDIGDVELGRPVHVRVQDRAGAPIAGAAVVVVDEGLAGTAATTAVDGTATLPFVAAAAGELLVRADGFASARVALPADDRLVVTLASGSTITVATDAEAALRSSLMLRVTADAMPFHGAGGEPLRPFRQEFPFDADGGRVLGDLEPGVLLHLTVVDSQGEGIAQADAVAPPLGRTDAVQLTVRDRFTALRGVVRDERGRPVPHAVVHLEAGPMALQELTGTDGRFAVGPLRGIAHAAHLEVRHPQFVTLVRHDAEFDPAAGELVFTLLRGRDLQVTVRQASGRPVAGALLLFTAGAAGMGIGREDEPGSYRFENVPMHAGVVTLQRFGREFTQPVGAADTVAELQVPDMATVRVPWPSSAAADRRISLVVTPLAPAGDAERTYFRAAEAGAVAPLQVLLPPGRYQLRLEALRPGGRARFDQVGSAQEITAVGGMDTELVFP